MGKRMGTSASSQKAREVLVPVDTTLHKLGTKGTRTWSCRTRGDVVAKTITWPNGSTDEKMRIVPRRGKRTADDEAIRVALKAIEKKRRRGWLDAVPRN